MQITDNLDMVLGTLDRPLFFSLDAVPPPLSLNR
jgi:hypothetical protein